MSQSPIVKFLGISDRSHGPFAMLDLPPARHADPVISRALVRQLDRIAAHPEGGTAAADEVRLALHVAAAQLRDAEVCDALVRRLSQARSVAPNGAAPSPSHAPTPVARPVAPPPDSSFDDIVRQLLAHSGGWNERSKLRIAAMAHAHGVGMQSLQQTLRRVSARQNAQKRLSQRDHRPATVIDGAPAEMPRESAPSAVRMRYPDANLAAIPTVKKRWTLALVMVSLMISSGVLVWSVIAIEHSRSRDELAEPGSPTIARPATSADLSRATEPPHVTSIETPVESLASRDGALPADRSAGPKFLTQVQRVRTNLSSDPEGAAAEFEEIINEIGANWVTFDRALLVPLQGAIIEYVHHASRADPELALDATHVLTQMALPLSRTTETLTASQIWPGVWGAGILTRLQRDEALPSQVQTSIEQAMRRIIEPSRQPRNPTFWTGAAAALDLMIDQLIPPSTGARSTEQVELAWGQWIACVSAIEHHEPGEAEALRLAALDRLLHTGEDPQIDTSTHAALHLLLETVPWTSEKAQHRLLAWFDDPKGVETGELHLITRWLVRTDAIEGLPLDMVLTAGAGPLTRIEIRDRYAAYLGLPVRENEQRLIDRWMNAAIASVGKDLGNVPNAEYLKHAAELARLNAVALYAWQHDDAGAEQAMNLVQRPIGLASRPGAPFDVATLTAPGFGSDGTWAREFLAMPRNQERRLRLLADLRQSSDMLGPADADVLVETAYYGSPRSVRDAATNIVRAFRDQPTVAYALIEAFDRAPKSDEARSLLNHVTGQTLPAADDPRWERAARRALVAHLANVLARALNADLDLYALHIAESYEEQTFALSSGLSGLSGNPIPDEDPDADSASFNRVPIRENISAYPIVGAEAHISAARLNGHWMAEAAAYRAPVEFGMSLDDLERRRRGRLSMATNSIQTFAAEQVSLAEVLAFLVAAERPSQIKSVVETLNRMSDQRRTARHMFQQIESAEQAMLKLWLIRLGWEDA